jgi:hypothetical protein
VNLTQVFSWQPPQPQPPAALHSSPTLSISPSLPDLTFNHRKVYISQK